MAKRRGNHPLHYHRESIEIVHDILSELAKFRIQGLSNMKMPISPNTRTRRLIVFLRKQDLITTKQIMMQHGKFYEYRNKITGKGMEFLKLLRKNKIFEFITTYGAYNYDMQDHETKLLHNLYEKGVVKIE